MAWKNDVKRILKRIADDPEYRRVFFLDRTAVLADEALDPLAYRYLTGRDAAAFRVNEDTFAEIYRQFFDADIVLGTSEVEEFPAIKTGDEGEEDGSPERIVSTGFATTSQPAQPIAAKMPLAPSDEYLFWFEVGDRVQGSIEVEDEELPTEKLPPEARLHVVLFSFDESLRITPGSDIGEIQIDRNGRVRVIRPVFLPPNLIGDELTTRRLFFPVRTSSQLGMHYLRCNVYYQQTLVQSRLITVLVTPAPVQQEAPALKAVVDYTLSRKLDGNQLEGMGKNKLSLMLNDNGDGTHGFRFFGEGEYKNDAALGEGELTDLIRKARGAMRKAAWGDESPYQPGKPYRYAGGYDEDRMKSDLIRFAVRGFRFYDALISRLAGDSDPWDLADLMLKPGQVQIASKQSARMVVPAALFYDYPLDDGRSDHTICATFLQARQSGTLLKETDCFRGECPSYDDDTVVCPSGFWGYRHSLGLPVSIGEASDAPPEISSPDKATLDISMYPNFQLLPEHLQRLEMMGLKGENAQSRDSTLAMLNTSQAQMIYFYCHGGVTNENIPFLQVDTDHNLRFTRANLRNRRVRWQKPRPLIFINGCHTTALSPDVAIDLVSGFVETSHAAGVIGTEITIFEPIAVAFAEACFDRFLIQRQTIGEAVRGARITLLQMGNPLGLVYIPFVMAGLKLTSES